MEHIRSVLLCEDLRQEITGREFIIGVFSGALLVSKMPLALPHLVIRLELNFRGAEVHQFKLRFNDPYGNTLFETDVIVQFSDWNRPGVVALRIPNFYFPVPGRYEVQANFDSEWSSAYELFIDVVSPDTMAHKMTAALALHNEAGDHSARS
jgi:hypothetical protein